MVGTGAAGAVLLGSGAGPEIARASSKTLNLGNIGWDEDVAVNNVVKSVLESRYGYTVNLKLADVGILFEGVGTGDLDAFLDVWMPNHTDYLNRVKSEVIHFAPWYLGITKFSMAAPAYMHIDSIAQINSSGATAIYGIEPGAVMTERIQKYAVPEYHLKVPFEPSSTAAMLAQVAKGYKAHQKFIFIAWAPHWMNAKYQITYLKDPKGALGNLTKPSKLSMIVHKGLQSKDPFAYKLLKSMRMTAAQVNSLEADIQKAGDPLKGAQVWIAKNKSYINTWLAAAKKA
jgi:glycine betaine/proline transport system substrate-binding protein